MAEAATEGACSQNDTCLSTESEYAEFLEFYNGLDIHPHWYQYLHYFQTLPDIYYYLLGVYIAVVCTIGVIGNFLVIYIFSTTKSLRTPPNMFIINLAISDMSFSAINGFPLMTISSFMRRWYFGNLTCLIYGFCGGFFGFISICTLAFVALDRYYVIAYPFEALRKCTHKRAFLQIVIVWLWAAALSVPPLFGFGNYVAEGLQVECTFDYVSTDLKNYIFNYWMLTFGFIVPVGIIAICYIKILKAVKAQGKTMRKQAERLGGKPSKEEREQKQEIQLAKIAAGTVSLFVISWLPYTIVSQLGVNGYLQYITPATTQIPVLFAKASASWNPVLYALSHPRFRAVLDEKFPFLVCCRSKNIHRGDEEKSEGTMTTKAKPKMQISSITRQDSSMSQQTSVIEDEVEMKTRPNNAPAPPAAADSNKV